MLINDSTLGMLMGKEKSIAKTILQSGFFLFVGKKYRILFCTTVNWRTRMRQGGGGISWIALVMQRD